METPDTTDPFTQQMMPGKQLFFVSEMVPANTHASSAVFYRHFRCLEKEGYHVTWITDQNSYNDFKSVVPTQWQVTILPNRAWFLPPYRPYGVLQYHRFYYYYRVLQRELLAAGAGSLLVTYVNGQFMAPFAAFLKARVKLPLISFLHDDVVELNFFRNKKSLIANTEKILAASDRVLIASDAFRRLWPAYARKFRNLYPIPEKYTGDRKKVNDHKSLVFGYSGTVYDEVVSSLTSIAAVLDDLGHQMIIVGNNPKVKEMQRRYPATVICREMFDEPAEANIFLATQCDAALVAYPEEISEMPWIATCFPSKFIQYCQLGLPGLVIAPKSSAIGQWCMENRWPLYTQNYQPSGIAQLASDCINEKTYNAVLHYKDNDFDPDQIQHRFEAVIRELIP